jgi:4-amino-4-deoxy-L-arabinose transferase-like glycosyltransferase
MGRPTNLSTADWLPIALVLIAAGVLYFWQLSSAPVYLGGEEARFGIHAHAIATTGRDLNGRFLPLFIRLDELARWYQPALFYLIAATLKVWTLSELAVRIPTAAIGVLDVLLIAAVARKLWPGQWYPVIGAILLALTPAHFILSRGARDFICVLPFVLAWLWCLLTFVENGHASMAFAAGAVLGVGVYTHIAAWVFMPMYVLVTWIVIAHARLNRRLALAVAIGFLLALLPLFAWVRTDPGVLGSTLRFYSVYDPEKPSLLTSNSIVERLSVYWDYFNPSYLFFAGGSNLTVCTRRAGVFPLAFAVLLPVGIYALWTNRGSAARLVLLAGLLTAPLGATLVNDRTAIQREIVVIPFGVLAAVAGAHFLFRHRSSFARTAAAVLVASVPLQFAVFFHDYLTDYQIRSAYWFDPGDFRDVADYLITTASSRDVPAVYVSNAVDEAAPRWRFFLTTHGRTDLWPRTRFFSRENLDVASVPAGSLLVLYPFEPQLADLVGPDKCCRIVHRVTAIGGAESAVILAK